MSVKLDLVKSRPGGGSCRPVRQIIISVDLLPSDEKRMWDVIGIKAARNLAVIVHVDVRVEVSSTPPPPPPAVQAVMPASHRAQEAA